MWLWDTSRFGWDSGGGEGVLRVVLLGGELHDGGIDMVHAT